MPYNSLASNSQAWNFSFKYHLSTFRGKRLFTWLLLRETLLHIRVHLRPKRHRKTNKNSSTKTGRNVLDVRNVYLYLEYTNLQISVSAELFKFTRCVMKFCCIQKLRFCQPSHFDIIVPTFSLWSTALR